MSAQSERAILRNGTATALISQGILMVHSGARLHGSWGVVGGGIGLVAIAPILPTLNPVGAFLLIAGFLVVAAIVAQFGLPATRGQRLDVVSP